MTEVQFKEDWMENKREKFKHQAKNADGETARIYAKGFLSFIQDLEEYDMDDFEAWLNLEYQSEQSVLDDEEAGKEGHFYAAGRQGAIKSLTDFLGIDLDDEFF